MFNPADGSPAGADLAYEGPANQRRGRADQYSKIVFQWQARRQPLQLSDLMAAAAAAAAPQQPAEGVLGLGGAGALGGMSAEQGAAPCTASAAEMQLDS